MSHDSTTMTDARSDEQGTTEALAHILPGWFQRFQEVAFLPLMIVAEMLVNGVMMASGLVPNPNNPFAGGWSHWLGEATWTALFLAGAVMGGMAIRTSAAASYWFSRNIRRALFNVLGMIGFVSLEVWAGVVQRSNNSIISPADTAVLSWAGVTHPSVSITDVVVALALPLAAMFWGFSAMKPSMKSAAEVNAEGAARIAKAEVNARVMQTRAAGLGSTMRAGVAAAFAHTDGATPKPEPEPPTDTPPDGSDNGPRGGGLNVGTQGGTNDLVYAPPVPILSGRVRSSQTHSARVGRTTASAGGTNQRPKRARVARVVRRRLTTAERMTLNHSIAEEVRQKIASGEPWTQTKVKNEYHVRNDVARDIWYEVQHGAPRLRAVGMR